MVLKTRSDWPIRPLTSHGSDPVRSIGPKSSWIRNKTCWIDGSTGELDELNGSLSELFDSTFFFSNNPSHAVATSHYRIKLLLPATGRLDVALLPTELFPSPLNHSFFQVFYFYFLPHLIIIYFLLYLLYFYFIIFKTYDF